MMGIIKKKNCYQVCNCFTFRQKTILVAGNFGKYKNTGPLVMSRLIND
jgi:hypothetical protein